MNVGALGAVGSLAASGASQRVAETDRAERDAAVQSRELHALARAEQSAGIGQTAEDSETSERDADGRRLWEIDHRASGEGETSPDLATGPLPAKDPSGDRGGALDLIG